jgi:hypothetical protein
MVMRLASCTAFLGALATLALAPAASATLTATVGRDLDVEAGQRIVIAENDGTQRRTLTTGEHSEISPDGTRVAVIDYDIRNFELVATTLKVLPVAGGPATLTIPADDLYLIGWSPDSATLLMGVTGNDRLLAIDAATGQQTELLALGTGTFGRVSLSPDMTRLAYVQYPDRPVRRGGTLKVLDLAARTTTTLRRHVDGVVWGPRAIAFGMLTRRRGEVVSDIARIEPEGTGFRRLTRIRPTQIYFGLSPSAWSADGRRLLTSVRGIDGYWRNTYGVDAVDGGARLIARGVEPTAFSRDGRFIIGQTGDVECCGFRHSDIVRVPWKRGGKQRVLIRHAMNASYSG